MSDHVLDDEALPPLEQISHICPYLIEPRGPVIYWELRTISGGLYDQGETLTYPQAIHAVQMAFSRLADQDTVIVRGKSDIAVCRSASPCPYARDGDL